MGGTGGYFTMGYALIPNSQDVLEKPEQSVSIPIGSLQEQPDRARSPLKWNANKFCRFYELADRLAFSQTW
jgi:hypothetical protein